MNEFNELIEMLIAEQNEIIEKVNLRLPNNTQPLITSRFDKRMTAIYLGTFSVIADMNRVKAILRESKKA